jgi:hypothetical protein
MPWQSGRKKFSLLGHAHVLAFAPTGSRRISIASLAASNELPT